LRKDGGCKSRSAARVIDARRATRHSVPRKYTIVLPGGCALISPPTARGGWLARTGKPGGGPQSFPLKMIIRRLRTRVPKRDGSVAANRRDSALTDDQRATREINSASLFYARKNCGAAWDPLKPQNVHKELYAHRRNAQRCGRKARTVQAILACDPTRFLMQHAADLAPLDAVV